MDQILSKINNVCRDAEFVFNFAECVPIVGVFSGGIRAAAGKGQALAGIILFVAGGLSYAGASLSSADSTTVNKLKVIYTYGAEHILHGCLNILRGLGAVLVGAVSCGIGNVALLLPNFAQTPPFSPALKYGTISGVPCSAESVFVKAATI